MSSSRADRLYLDWQFATPYPDPGPPPRRPTPPEHERLNPDWAAAQRHERVRVVQVLKDAFARHGHLVEIGPIGVEHAPLP